MNQRPGESFQTWSYRTQLMRKLERAQYKETIHQRPLTKPLRSPQNDSNIGRFAKLMKQLFKYAEQLGPFTAPPITAGVCSSSMTIDDVLPERQILIFDDRIY